MQFILRPHFRCTGAGGWFWCIWGFWAGEGSLERTDRPLGDVRQPWMVLDNVRLGRTSGHDTSNPAECSRDML
jgi:hypothetical protein